MGLGWGVLGVPTRWESWGGDRADMARPLAMCIHPALGHSLQVTSLYRGGV